MKTREISEKYNIEKLAFEKFIDKRGLKTRGILYYDVPNELVENYVNQYLEYKIELDSAKKQEQEKKIKNENPGLELPVEGALYSVKGVRGRHIDVFDNKCVIKTAPTIGSLLTRNATDGEKTIYYMDVVGVQFKEPGLTIGFLQLETPGLAMNNASSNFFNENSFTFDTSVISTIKMKEIATYIEGRVQEIKHRKIETPVPQEPVAVSYSPADELLKYKQLLDMGALTQEEFEAKKKQLLGL